MKNLITKLLTGLKCGLFSLLHGMLVAVFLTPQSLGIPTVYAEEPERNETVNDGRDNSQSPAVFLQEIENTARKLRLILEDLPRESYSLSAVVREQGGDSEVLLTWIRENTQHVSYTGVLRAGEGTLQERTGNHLDRAILLGGLLEEAGHSVFLEKRPKDEQIRPTAILDRGLRPDTYSLSEDTLELIELIDPGSRSRWDKARANPHKDLFSADLQLRAHTLSRSLLAMEGFPEWTPQTTPPPKISDPRFLVWWREKGSEIWRSVDPASTDDPTTRPRPPDGNLLTLEAAAEKHGFTLRLRVVLERMGNRGRERITALEHSFPAEIVQMEPIRISVIPVDIKNNEFYGEDLLADFSEDLLLNEEWFPYFSFRGETYFDRLIQRNGELGDPTEPATSKAMGRAAGALGSIGMGGKQEPAEPKDAFLGLDLELTIFQYGEELASVNRPWFSLPDPDPSGQALDRDARLTRATALMRDSNLVVQTSEPSEPYIVARTLRSTLRNLEAMPFLVDAWETGDLEEIESAFFQTEQIPAALWRFAKQRFLSAFTPAQMYIATPNLLLEHTGVWMGDEDFGTYQAIDLAHVPLHWLENDLKPEARAVRAMRHGVLETVLEAQLFEFIDLNPVEETGFIHQTQSAALFSETALAQGHSGKWISPDNAGDLETLDLPKHTQQVISKVLTSGKHLYFPLQGQKLAENIEGQPVWVWWSVDPATGETLGYGPGGWGSNIVQDAMLRVQVSIYLLKASLAPTVAKSALGSALVCAFAYANAVVWVYTGLGGSTGSDVVDFIGGKGEEILNFCASVYNRRMNPRLPK